MSSTSSRSWFPMTLLIGFACACAVVVLALGKGRPEGTVAPPSGGSLSLADPLLPPGSPPLPETPGSSRSIAPGGIEGRLSVLGANRGFSEAGIRIVMPGMTEGVQTARTDLDGRFLLLQVPPGEYDVVVVLPGTRQPTRMEERWVVRSNETTKKDLFLEAPVPESRGFMARGRCVYRDGRAAGAFRCRLREASGNEGAFEVKGTGGVFEKRLPVPGLYEVLDFEADGVVHGDLESEVLLEAGSEASIVVEEPREVMLLVTDGRSGTPVPSARALLRDAGQSRYSWSGYPSDQDLRGKALVADSGGRIPLGRGTGYKRLFVGAEGLSWECITAFHGGPREVPVKLRPAGSVLLRLPRWKEWPGAHLRMLAPGRITVDEEADLPAPGADGTLLLVALPEGETEFRVDRGLHWAKEQEYASGEVTVEAGKEVELTLDSEEVTHSATVPVHGTLIMSPAWRRTRTVIHLWGKEGPTRGLAAGTEVALSSTGSPVPFDLGTLPAGDYVVEVEPLWRVPVRVGSADDGIRLEMPEPAEVRVRVVERGTDRDVGPARFSWVPVDLSLSRYHAERVVRDPGTKEFVFLAAPGKYRLWPSAEGYVGVDRFASPDRLEHEDRRYPGSTMEVPGGDDPPGMLDLTAARRGEVVRITLPLRPAGAFRLVLRGDSNLLDRANLRTEEEGAGAVSYGLGWEGNVSSLTGLPPGNYVLELRTYGGTKRRDEPVRIDAGRTTEVAIDLP